MVAAEAIFDLVSTHKDEAAGKEPAEYQTALEKSWVRQTAE